MSTNSDTGYALMSHACSTAAVERGSSRRAVKRRKVGIGKERVHDGAERASATILHDPPDGYDTTRNQETARQSRSAQAASSKSNDTQSLLPRGVLAKALSLGTMTFRSMAMHDDTDVISQNLQGLSLAISSVLDCYNNVIRAQLSDFQAQYKMPSPKRTWEAFIYQHPVLLTMAILCAIRHRLDYTPAIPSGTSTAPLLALERFQLSRTSHAIDGSSESVSDEMLMSVTLFAAYEAKHTTAGNAHLHLDGLARMINMRGGLTSIGDGDRNVERLLVWMIINICEVAGGHQTMESVLRQSEVTRPQAKPATFRMKPVTALKRDNKAAPGPSRCS